MTSTVRYRGGLPARGSLYFGADPVSGLFFGDQRVWPDYLDFVADPASFVLTGQVVDIIHARRLDAAAAAFTLTGYDADLIVASGIQAFVGEFILTGQDADIYKTLFLDAEAGTFTLSGLDADFIRALRIGGGNEFIWEFNTDEDGWIGGGSSLSVTEGILTQTNASPDNQLIRTGLSIDGSTYTRVKALIRRISGAGAWQGQCYYGIDGGHSFDGSFIKTISEPADPSAWTMLEWDMSDLTAGGSDWITNTITAVRLDLWGFGDVVEIDLIAVESTGAGTFVLTGQDAGLYKMFWLEAEAGTFVLTGEDAGSVFNYVIEADAGAFTLTGQDADLLASLVLAADAGAFTLTGEDSDRTISIFFSADAGSFVLTGQDATFEFPKRLLSGDQQTGTDRRILSGDQAPGFRLVSYN